MSISVDTSFYQNLYDSVSTSNDTNKLSSALSSAESGNASDEELMSVCKSFESYLIEQMVKDMEKTVMKDDSEEENDYMKMFKDTMNQSYAELMSRDLDLGIAQSMYDSIKRN